MADEFDTTPSFSQNVEVSARNINKLLEDAVTGTAPIEVTGGGVSGGLTDAQLRATPVPVVGTRPTASTNSPTQFLNVGANATLNVKASAGNVFSLYCHNSNAATRFIQLHNTATVPSTGVTIPVFSFPVYANGCTVIGTDFFTNEGCHFATGIAFAFSTTRDVYTAATAGEQQTSIQYK